MAAIFTVNTARFRTLLEGLHRKLNLRAEQTKLVLAGRGLEMHGDKGAVGVHLATYDFITDEWQIHGTIADPSKDPQVGLDLME